jgi:DNA-binding MarR family transcriptional regulator
MQRLITIFNEFRKFDTEMPIQTAITLLLVSEYQDRDDGLCVKDLANLLGISTAAASRNVAKLSKVGVKSSTGHGLVEALEDPMYRVRKTVRLTKKGEHVISTLKELMHEHKTEKSRV